MRRFLALMIAVMLSLSLTPVQAESDHLSALHAACPQWSVLASVQQTTVHGQQIAAAILEKKDARMLAVLQKRDGNWRLDIANETALPTGKTPTLSLDRDGILSWSLHGPAPAGEYVGDITVTCSSTLTYDGVWQPVIVTLTSEHAGMQHVASFWHEGTTLQIQRRFIDPASGRNKTDPTYAPLPDLWLADQLSLAAFDYSLVTGMCLLAYSAPKGNPEWLQNAARELRPDYTYLDGHWDQDGLQLLMQRPDGETVFIGAAYASNLGVEPVVCESTPLPEGTQLGNENMYATLSCPGQFTVSLAPMERGVWGVRTIYTPDGEIAASFGPCWVGDCSDLYLFNQYTLCGKSPFDDVRTIDWAQLAAVKSYNDAANALDKSDWACVNNPRMADRLHLRAAPDRKAESLGKYYNRTPVQILSTEGEWAYVEVLDLNNPLDEALVQRGYMMRKYLATGRAMESVETYEIDYHPVQRLTSVSFYDAPAGNLQRTLTDLPLENDMWILLGLSTGETWGYFWNPQTNFAGWAHLSDFEPGNG